MSIAGVRRLRQIAEAPPVITTAERMALYSQLYGDRARTDPDLFQNQRPVPVHDGEQGCPEPSGPGLLPSD